MLHLSNLNHLDYILCLFKDRESYRYMLCMCSLYVICITTILNLQSEIRKSCMRKQNAYMITRNDGSGLRLSAVLKYIASSTSSHTGTNIILRGGWDRPRVAL